jgi:hypothetical protein
LANKPSACVDAEGIHEVSEKNLDPVTVVFISEHDDRVACVRQDFDTYASEVRLVVKPPTHRTASQVRQLHAGSRSRAVLLFDFTIDTIPARHVIKSLAFGDSRYEGLTGILTSPATEAILENGDLDSGTAVMFSPTEVRSFLSKLGGDGREEIIHSIGVLNQYGPVLFRAHDECAACRKPALKSAALQSGVR